MGYSGKELLSGSLCQSVQTKTRLRTNSRGVTGKKETTRHSLRMRAEISGSDLSTTLCVSGQMLEGRKSVWFSEIYELIKSGL